MIAGIEAWCLEHRTSERAFRDHNIRKQFCLLGNVSSSSCLISDWVWNISARLKHRFMCLAAKAESRSLDYATRHGWCPKWGPETLIHWARSNPPYRDGSVESLGNRTESPETVVVADPAIWTRDLLVNPIFLKKQMMLHSIGMPSTKRPVVSILSEITG